MIDTRALLDTLLQRSQQVTDAGSRLVQDRQLLPADRDERTAMLEGLGAGALAAGATSMLFGSKSTKKFVKKAAVLGGTAGIGALAFKVISDLQAQQNATTRVDSGTPINQLPDVAAQARSHAIVQAMISAARADGHVDSDERARITQQIEHLGLEQDMSDFLLSEMSQPVDATRIAALATDTESAAEIYLASALALDIDGDAERTYLDALATALKLDATVAASLEASIAAHGAG